MKDRAAWNHWIFAVIGVVGTIFAIIYGLLPFVIRAFTQGKTLTEVSLTWALLATILISVLVIAFLTWMFWRNIEDISRLHEYQAEAERSTAMSIQIANLYHNILDEMRNIVFQLDAAAEQIREGSISSAEAGAAQTRIYRNWQMFNLNTLANIASLFSTTTGDKCASCIKLIKLIEETEVGSADEPPPKDLRDTSVFTYLRDPMSYRKRHETDIRLHRYPNSTNTAFGTIINEDSRAFYFMSNDLKALPDYVNTNARWREFYNACLVVPIRCPALCVLADPINPDTRQDRYELFGFLCIDSLKGHFTVARELELVCGLADAYFVVFKAFERFCLAYRECISESQDERPATAASRPTVVSGESSPISGGGLSRA